MSNRVTAPLAASLFATTGLLFSACTGGGGQAASTAGTPAASSPSPRPSDSLSPSGSEGHPLPLKTPTAVPNAGQLAMGIGVSNIHHASLVTTAGRLLPLSLTDDGMVISRGFTGSSLADGAFIASLSPATGTVTKLVELEPNTDVVEAQLIGDELYWFEGPVVENDSFDWSLRRTRLGSGAITLLARAPRNASGFVPPEVPAGPHLCFTRTSIVWTQADPVGAHGWQMDIVALPLSGRGKPAKVIGGAWSSATVGDDVYGMQSGMAHVGRRTGGTFAAVKVRAGKQSSIYQGKLSSTQALVGFTVARPGVSWVIQDGFDQPTNVIGSTLYVLLSGGSTPRATSSPKNEAWVGVVASDTVLGWFDGQTSATNAYQYVGSWRGSSYTPLASARGIQVVLVNGRRVGWSTRTAGTASLAAYATGEVDPAVFR